MKTIKTLNLSVKGFTQFAKYYNDIVKQYGFNDADVPLRIALIHSEISEAFEAFRNDKFAYRDLFLKHTEAENKFHGKKIFNKSAFENNIKDSFEDEIADTLLRIFDLIGWLEIDIDFFIKNKMKYNETRGFKFGNKKF